ncbi:hypothetical protein B0I37DRAFT_373726 [Chaetomium sp. MPI-CAGE-AT-0009]|nr:hypothetical protein B0I37DRAFT_373726 [Chaetomium sp. MPI-CAGE-AT-0009]
MPNIEKYLTRFDGLDFWFASIPACPGPTSQHQHQSAHKMLRPRPSVISLTRADVTEVVHRRRFRRFLECEEDNICVDFAPVETDTTYKIDRPEASPSRTAQRKTTPKSYNSTRKSSPTMHSEIRHWVTDLPLLLLANKEVGEDVPSPPEVSGSQVRYSRTRRNPQRGSDWTLQLCLRPKRGLPAATAPAADDGSTGSQDSRENSTGESPGNSQGTKQRGIAVIHEPGLSSPGLSNVDSPSMRGGETYQATPTRRDGLSGDSTDANLESGAGPSTPQRRLPSESLGSPPTAPNASNRISRLSFNASDTCQGDGVSSETSSPSPAFMSPGRLRIYNDFLPASSQPQTPQNLPEARHQGRPQGSYTVPARRTSPQPPRTQTAIRSRRVWRRRREPSPLGLRTLGLEGLYGGTENMDDAELVEEMAEDMARSWASPSRPSDSA